MATFENAVLRRLEMSSWSGIHIPGLLSLLISRYDRQHFPDGFCQAYLRLLTSFNPADDLHKLRLHAPDLDVHLQPLHCCEHGSLET